MDKLDEIAEGIKRIEEMTLELKQSYIEQDKRTMYISWQVEQLKRNVKIMQALLFEEEGTWQ